MSVYTNAECPYCNKRIGSDDELVVCPTCGTPHHRSCYFENGHCFNESRHEEGFEWTPPVRETAQSGEMIACSNCGKSISKDSVFCNYCGTPVNPHITGGTGGSLASQQDTMFFGVEDQQPAYNMSEEVDGIAIKDWITYIGQNFQYYLYNFEVQDKTKRKTSFTLSAALFPPLYFLYRRVWGAAAIAAVLNLLFNFPAVILYYDIFPAGFDLGLSTLTWERISGVCSVLSVFVNLAWGLFAVWLYRKKALKHIGRIRAESPTEEVYAQRLQQVSGPSRKAIMVLAISFVALLFFSALYIGLTGFSV